MITIHPDPWCIGVMFNQNTIGQILQIFEPISVISNENLRFRRGNVQTWAVIINRNIKLTLKPQLFQHRIENLSRCINFIHAEVIDSSKQNVKYHFQWS